MIEQKRCPDSNCDFDKAQCGCAVEINAETYKDSLLVEQDVNRCETKLEIKQLKTKSELMAKLEKDAEVIRTHFYDCDICEYKESGKKALMLFVDSERYFIGNEFEYRQDPIAPVKGRTVISKSGRLWVSSGELHGDMLNVFDYSEIEEISCLRHWCDYFDRSHHSPGWRKEWEPRE